MTWEKLMKEKSELLQTTTFSQNMSYCSYLLVHVCVSWNKTKLKISWSCVIQRKCGKYSMADSLHK